MVERRGKKLRGTQTPHLLMYQKWSLPTSFYVIKALSWCKVNFGPSPLIRIIESPPLVRLIFYFSNISLSNIWPYSEGVPCQPFPVLYTVIPVVTPELLPFSDPPVSSYFILDESHNALLPSSLTRNLTSPREGRVVSSPSRLWIKTFDGSQRLSVFLLP